HTTAMPFTYPPPLHDALPIARMSSRIEPGTPHPPGTPVSLLRARRAQPEDVDHVVDVHESVPGRGFRRPQLDRVGLQLDGRATRSEEHTSELQSRENLVCRLL